ncbi:MAG: hypothetical protein LBQ31_05435 [Bacteroidales bacterium]|jgi:hypothetical protein|nr:hypothetical protein [Bacteroidales bacterium]
MTTLVLKNNSLAAVQFLKFARTLPYVDVIETAPNSVGNYELKDVVVDTMRKTELGEDLTICKDAEDMFNKLGI